MSDRPNLAPADELAAVRAELKALEGREAALKQLLISDPSSRSGNHYLAEVREVETTRTDLKELRANHRELVDEYTFPAKVMRVELSAITEDGEIVPARRAPKLHTIRVV